MVHQLFLSITLQKNLKEMLAGQLPQPAYTLNGKFINLYVSDTLPKRSYNPKGGQKFHQYKPTTGKATKIF